MALLSGFIKNKATVYSSSADFATNDTNLSGDYPSLTLPTDLVVGAYYEAIINATVIHRDNVGPQIMYLRSASSGGGTCYGHHEFTHFFGSTNAAPISKNLTWSITFKAVSTSLFLYVEHNDNFAGFLDTSVTLFRRKDIA